MYSKPGKAKTDPGGTVTEHDQPGRNADPKSPGKVRDAGTGEYKPKPAAKKDPDGTQTEHDPKPKKR